MLWYSSSHQGASNEYPQHMFSWGNKKNINLIPTHPLLSSDMYPHLQQKMEEKIFLSMAANYLPVEMTGNYRPNIQQTIIGTRGKNFSRRHFEIHVFFLFFPELWQCLFSGKIKKLSSICLGIFPESGNGKRQTLFMHVWKMGLILKVIKRFKAQYHFKHQNWLTFLYQLFRYAKTRTFPFF